jgi:hypothetical protein
LDGVIISAPITVGGSGTTATISAPINAPGALSRTSSKPAPRAGRCC